MQKLFALFLLVMCFVPQSTLYAKTCGLKSVAQIKAGFLGVDALIRERMSKERITAVSLIITKDGHTLFEAAYGKDIELDTRFQAASISKPVAAFSALQLVEKGLLSLSTPMVNFVKLPFHPEEPFAPLITLQQLLNHTSGLYNDPEATDRKIYFKPGSAYHYSGAGFYYAQLAMQDVTGESFEKVTDGTLASLGMRNSSFHMEYQGAQYVNAAYSLMTTPRDLSRFFNELVTPAKKTEHIVHLMKTIRVDVDANLKKGLGIGMYECDDELALFHSGRNFSLHHSLGLIFEQSKLGIVVMARGEDSRFFPFVIAQAAIGAEIPGLSPSN